MENNFQFYNLDGNWIRLDRIEGIEKISNDVDNLTAGFHVFGSGAAYCWICRPVKDIEELQNIRRSLLITLTLEEPLKLPKELSVSTTSPVLVNDPTTNPTGNPTPNIPAN